MWGTRFQTGWYFFAKFICRNKGSDLLNILNNGQLLLLNGRLTEPSLVHEGACLVATVSAVWGQLGGNGRSIFASLAHLNFEVTVWWQRCLRLVVTLPKPTLWCYQSTTSADTNTSTLPNHHFCRNQHFDATNPTLCRNQHFDATNQPLLPITTLRRYQITNSPETNTLTLPNHYFCRNQHFNATNPPLLPKLNYQFTVYIKTFYQN